MKSFHITREPGHYRLMERDYVCQGVKPDYTTICLLTDEEAADLVASKLVDPWIGVEVDATAGEPSRLLTLRAAAGYPGAVVTLSLPAIPGRAAMELDLPESDYIMGKVSSDRTERAGFLRATRIRSKWPVNQAA